MTLLTDEERAKLVALEKEATPGPWRAAAPKGRATGYTSIVEGADGRMALFAGTPFRSDEEIVANCALTVATRNALSSLLAADAAVRGMREALEAIWQYGSDTLSGRADGGPDDRRWQRDAVLEMTNRASAAIEKATKP